MTDPAQQRPQCSRCVHYNVTWNADRPYRCEALGFESKRLPCQVVYESSGEPCHSFREKQLKPVG